MRTGSGRRGLAPFLDDVERRLGSLSPDQLRTALVRHAEGLRPAERDAFLHIFDRPGRQRRPKPAEDPLLRDIDALVDRLRSGAYVDGSGWDPDLYDERVFGDESWAGEMDDLLHDAGKAFLDGDLDVAREAYGRLLHALLLEEEGEVFPGPRTAPEMVQSDVPEAVARYLRALYETTPFEDRPTRLVEELEALWHFAPDVALADVEAARREPLPDLDSFLPRWIQRLEAVEAGSRGFADTANRLLSEAVGRLGGTTALGDLARRRADRDPEAVLRWLDAMLETGAGQEMEAACLEGLDLLAGRAEHVRARVAERLAAVRTTRGDREGALAATREAWRSAPTTARLVRLAQAGADLGRQDEILREEADAVEATLGLAGRVPLGGRRSGERTSPDARLASALLLLAGRVPTALKLLRRADALGWQRADHPGPVVVPFLLCAAVGVAAHETFAHRLLAGVDTLAADPWSALDDLMENAAPDTDPPSLAGLLTQTLGRQTHSDKERSQWLDAARVAVEARTAAVVEAKHRGAYRRVAELVVTCGETLALVRGLQAGTGFVAEVRDRYPRHVAFRREIESSVRASRIIEGRVPKRLR